MDYIEGVTVKRLKKVIGGEQGGISNEYNWVGGGSFIYCELAKANHLYVEAIQSAKSLKKLKSIWATMQKKAFISYNIEVKKINENITEFEELSPEDQKRFLIEVLDKNML